MKKWLRLDLLAGFLAGLALGLIYAWLLAPVQYTDTTPDTLRSDYKDQYRFLAASAYAATGNLERARSRLSLLGDPDPVQVLTAQAQRILAEGQPMAAVQMLAALASALQNSQASLPQASPTPALPLLLSETVPPPTAGLTPASPSPAGEASPAPAVPSDTPVPLQSPTPRPTRTPSPTPGASFALSRQEPVCNPALPDGLLQVTVLDAARKPVPGIELVITWSGGEEHFFTGLKPDVSNGYADFLMTPEVTYSLRLLAGSAPLTGLTAPACQMEGGGEYWGGLRLEFQQP